MAKFAIECPKCGSVNTASNFILAKKVIKCGTCNNEIDIRTSKLTSKVCPHCEKVFVYDQSKPHKDHCPACGKRVDVNATATAKFKMVKINCPQCACSIEVDETKDTYFCPICDLQLDVKKEIAKQKLVNDVGVSVIQYEGGNDTFIWKHPIEDFNMGTQLVVHESQEAIFFLNGEALDSFGPGRHTLETENLPVLKKIYALPTGHQTPFHCEVYFINKTVQMGIKWGTDSRVRFIDPVTGIPLDIGASGELNLQVENGRKLLIKLVGTAGGLKNREVLQAASDATGTIHKTLQSYFRAPLMTEIKSYLASAIKEQKINILEIDEKMSELSAALCAKISPKFEEYGLAIPQFYITNVSLPEDDKNFKDIRALISQAYIGVKAEEVKASVARAAQETEIVKAQTEAQLAAIKAQGEAEALKARGFAEAEVMRAKGYTEKDVIEADVQKAYAEGIGNMGSNGGGGGSVAGDLIGLVAGMKAAEGMTDRLGMAMNGAMNNTAPTPAAPVAAAEETWTCSCGEAGNTKKFCMNCGSPKPEAWTCSCGHAGNKGKFCEECGAKRDEGWDCACGVKKITSKFCPECGAKRPE